MLNILELEFLKLKTWRPRRSFLGSIDLSRSYMEHIRKLIWHRMRWGSFLHAVDDFLQVLDGFQQSRIQEVPANNSCKFLSIQVTQKQGISFFDEKTKSHEMLNVLHRVTPTLLKVPLSTVGCLQIRLVRQIPDFNSDPCLKKTELKIESLQRIESTFGQVN